MNHLYHDPRDSSAFAEKREYVNPSERDLRRFREKFIETEGCWNWNSNTRKNGYGLFSFNLRYISAHRVAFAFSRGYFPTDLSVCHKCDNRRCVRPDHLFSGTRVDNMQDCLQKGRFAQGDRHPTKYLPPYMPFGVNCAASKLTEKQVREIRKLAAEGMRYVDIGLIHCISKNAISALVTRKTWKHVT